MKQTSDKKIIQNGTIKKTTGPLIVQPKKNQVTPVSQTKAVIEMPKVVVMNNLIKLSTKLPRKQFLK